MANEFIFIDPPFKSCHSPTLERIDGGLMAAWFGGNSEGHKKTNIWISVKKGSRWSEPMSVANGKQKSGRSFACWNPVLYKKENDDILLFYKLGTSPENWWGMQITSLDQGKTWSIPTKLPRKIFGPTKNKPMLLTDGQLLCPASDERGDWWRIHFEVMSNFGWRRVSPPNPKEFGCIQPAILRHTGSTLQALCRSNNGCIVETWSHDEGLTWEPLSATHLPNPNSAIDAVSLSNDKHVLIYNNTTMNRSSLVVAISSNGRDWKNSIYVETGDGEFSYPSIVRGSEDSVHIVYTWNRENIKYVFLEGDVLGS